MKPGSSVCHLVYSSNEFAMKKIISRGQKISTAISLCLAFHLLHSHNIRIFLIALQLAHVSHVQAASLDELFKPLLFFCQR